MQFLPLSSSTLVLVAALRDEAEDDAGGDEPDAGERDDLADRAAAVLTTVTGGLSLGIAIALCSCALTSTVVS